MNNFDAFTANPARMKVKLGDIVDLDEESLSIGRVCNLYGGLSQFERAFADDAGHFARVYNAAKMNQYFCS